jgi:dTDP-4-amino-4,6-dideoxy-D-galactose acyltransferase
LPTAAYELGELDWDTKFFGIKMGQVILPVLSENQGFSEMAWRRTLETARAQNYQFLYCPFDVSHQGIANSIAAQGGEIGDILLTFSLESAKHKKRRLQYRVTEAKQGDLAEILEIARIGFRNSRFFQDPHFDRVKAGQFYPSWLQESFLSAEKILVIKQEGRVLGFISLKPVSETGTETLIIRLIAVAESCQGKRIGQTLIDEAINEALTQKYRYLQVGTQITNYAAINLYEKNGFRVTNAKYRFHIWIN